MEQSNEKSNWVCIIFYSSWNADYADAAKCLCWSCVDFYMSHSWL